MAGRTENTEAIRHALAYAIALYEELTGENGAPTPGTQNQAVDFILAEPRLREAVARWAATVETAEATIVPSRRLPQDALYRQVRAALEGTIGPAPFAPS